MQNQEIRTDNTCDVWCLWLQADGMQTAWILPAQRYKQQIPFCYDDACAVHTLTVNY